MEDGGPDSGFLFREQAEGQRSRIGGQNTSPSLLSLCMYLFTSYFLSCFLGGYPSLCAPADLSRRCDENKRTMIYLLPPIDIVVHTDVDTVN